MMTTAAEKGAVPAEKKKEKVEKRRALGRGLESLLPGPRVVSGSESRVPSPESLVASAQPSPPFAKDAKDGAPPQFVRNDKGLLERPADSGAMDGSRTGVSDPHEPATHEPSFSPFEEVVPGEVIEIQAVADDRIVGNKVVHVPLQLIEKNPYQPRSVFEESALEEVRGPI